MKALILCTLLAVSSAFGALNDDLFYAEGAPNLVTARSFTWRGKVYGSVRIMKMEGENVTLHTKQGLVIVPFDSLPKLWQDAMHHRDWPINANQPVKQPGYKTVAEWEKARAAAELVARTEAAKTWEGNYEMQVFVKEKQMAAWEKLYPKPVVPAAKPVPAPAPAYFPPGPEAPDAFLNKTQSYQVAREAAEAYFEEEAGKAYPNTPDARDAKKAKLLSLWDARYPKP